MALEIERKFLVVGEYKSLAASHSRITQGYISSASGRTVRVRIRGDKGYLTIKGPALGGNGVEPESEASGAIPVPAITMIRNVSMGCRSSTLISGLKWRSPS